MRTPSWRNQSRWARIEEKWEALSSHTPYGGLGAAYLILIIVSFFFVLLYYFTVFTLIAVALATTIYFFFVAPRRKRKKTEKEIHFVPEFRIYRKGKTNIRAVKRGWSWPAFFFSCIWAFAKGLNSLAGSILIVGVLIGAVLGTVTSGDTQEELLFLEWISFAVWLGIRGNKELEKSLAQKGFTFCKPVYAETGKKAVSLFLSANEFVCSQCGARLSADDGFCQTCGARDDGYEDNGTEESRSDEDFPPFDPSLNAETEKAKHYGRVLGLRGKVTVQDIKRNYKDLIAKNHPDKVQHMHEDFQRLAESKTKEINEAYEYFKNKYSFD